MPFSKDRFHPFRNKSTAPLHFDSSQFPILEQYLNHTQQALYSSKCIFPKSNLSSAQRQACKELSTLPNTIIIKASKGDSIVILDTQQYHLLAYNYLNDRTTYMKLLQSEGTSEVAQNVHSYLSKLYAAGFIDSITFDFLKPSDKLRTQLQGIHFLPKLDKKPIAVRPIVSCCSGPTEGVPAYLDFFFQPQMKSVSSYLANSIQFVNILKTSHFSLTCFFVTLDVSSLY